MPTGNIPRFTHQAHTYEMPVKNAYTYSLCLATLLFLPIWVQHLTAADGGLMAVGGGKISEEEIFGKTNKKGVQIGGYPKLMFHCLAIIGNTAIWFSVLCILVSYYGNMKQKQAVAGVRSAGAHYKFDGAEPPHNVPRLERRRVDGEPAARGVRAVQRHVEGRRVHWERLVRTGDAHVAHREVNSRYGAAYHNERHNR